MQLIALTRGLFAQVDDSDYLWLNEFTWAAMKAKYTYYAVTTIKIDGKPKTFLMHRMIMETPPNLECDHQYGNGINNQRYNLRNCTHSQNQMNKKGKVIRDSKYKGIFKKVFEQKTFYNHSVRFDHPFCIKYGARIVINKKYIHIGIYETEIEAAIAYNKKAIELFGEYASLNIIE